MANILPPDILKALLGRTQKGTSVQNIIKILSRRKSPIPTPELRERLGIKNVCHSARMANRYLEPNGYQVTCKKVGATRDSFAWTIEKQ